jgi:hypothetical protein
MFRLIALVALAGGLAGCAASPFSQAPASQVAPNSTQSMGPGASHNPSECVTDEGNGRYLPCGYASGSP